MAGERYGCAGNIAFLLKRIKILNSNCSLWTNSKPIPSLFARQTICNLQSEKPKATTDNRKTWVQHMIRPPIGSDPERNGCIFIHNCSRGLCHTGQHTAFCFVMCLHFALARCTHTAHRNPARDQIDFSLIVNNGNALLLASRLWLFAQIADRRSRRLRELLAAAAAA